MLAKLNVKNAKVLWTRIEEYKWEKADIITARAVAYSDKLLKRSYSHLKDDDERSLLLELCKKYHLSLEKEIEYSLFEEDIQRVIYVLRKI